MFRPVARRISLGNGAMYKKSHPDGTASQLEWNKKALGVVGGLALLVGGTFSLLLSHPRNAVELASAYDPRARDDQHKRPVNDADAARVAIHQRGAPLAKNI